MQIRQEAILGRSKGDRAEHVRAHVIAPAARVARLEARLASLETENAALRKAREAWKQRALRAEMSP